MYLKIKLSVLAIILIASVSFSKAPVRFGKVSQEEMTMSVYEKDSSAAAVVLCDYGYFTVRDYSFTRVLRIKILNKDGLDYADMTFPVNSKGMMRAICFNMEEGKIEKYKAKSDNIFVEQVYENYFRTRVSLPNVKVGSVLDFTYTISEFPASLPAEWYFQREIPVVHSELVIEPSEYYTYQKNFFGYERLSHIGANEWIATEMPAFREEPYMSSKENYITKFEFDLQSVHIPGQLYEDFSASWSSINEKLMKSDYFGHFFSRTGPVKDMAEEIRTTVDKTGWLQAAYEKIKEIRWNESYGVFTDTNSPNRILKDKTGSVSEINLLLCALLKELEFNVYPVAMSTRTNGLLSQFRPSMNKLNYTIVGLETEGKVTLLDATEPLLPAGMLPTRCINWMGRKVNNAMGDWVDLSPSEIDKSMLMANLNFTGEGKIVGNIQSKKSGYGAYNFRKKLNSLGNEDEYIKDLENDNPGLDIKECEISNTDNIYEDITEKMEVEISGMQEMADMIYLNPNIIGKIDKNPFTVEKRKYPVDFPYLSNDTYVMNLTIPENYTVEEMPEPFQVSLPNNSGVYRYILNKNGNTITLSASFAINKRVFVEDEYPLIKEFFNQIIKKQNELIILKKI